jgi:putative Holliday junction resolvase
LFTSKNPGQAGVFCCPSLPISGRTFAFMARILGIDYGLKRTGLAVTDPLRMFAQPIGMVETSTLFAWLERYGQENEVDSIAIGMPLNLDGSDTHNSQPVREFVAQLRNRYPQWHLYLIDERMSSREAKASILASGASKAKRREKGLVDTVSAALILQTHLSQLP